MRRAALWVAAVAALAYLPSFAGAFQFDDLNVIVGDPTVHSWSAWALHAGAGLRPLLKASYTLNWTIGPGPFGFHLLNVALHASNAALLFLLGRSLFPEHSRAMLFAALLFALHPAQTEAVTYLSGRSTSMMATLYLCGLLAYLRGRRGLSLVLFALALAVRETAVTLPAALVLCELARGTPWRDMARRQWAHWLLLACALAFAWLSPRYSEFLSYGFTRRGMWSNLVTQAGGIGYLVLQLLRPWGANIDPALPTLRSLDGALAFQAAMLLSLIALAALGGRARPWLTFGVLWFFLHLAPTNSFVPRLDVANDRQLYLACWGLFLAACVQASYACDAKAPFSLAASAIAALLGVASIARQLDYRDPVTLWEATVRAAPWNARAHNNLGYAYRTAGRVADAGREYEMALRFEPRYEKARANLVLLGAQKNATEP